MPYRHGLRGALKPKPNSEELCSELTYKGQSFVDLRISKLQKSLSGDKNTTQTFHDMVDSEEFIIETQEVFEQQAKKQVHQLDRDREAEARRVEAMRAEVRSAEALRIEAMKSEAMRVKAMRVKAAAARFEAEQLAWRKEMAIMRRGTSRAWILKELG